MVSSASSRPETAAAPAAGERSPFARLTELLAPYQPGQKLINLSLGEPQHPMPSFVGDVLAKNLAGFGRYPASNGILEFRAAATAWMSRRYKLPRALDPVAYVRFASVYRDFREARDFNNLVDELESGASQAPEPEPQPGKASERA